MYSIGKEDKESSSYIVNVNEVEWPNIVSMTGCYMPTKRFGIAALKIADVISSRGYRGVYEQSEFTHAEICRRDSTYVVIPRALMPIIVNKSISQFIALFCCKQALPSSPPLPFFPFKAPEYRT